MAPCCSMLLSMFSYDSLCLQMVSLRLPMALLGPFCSLLSPFGPFWPLSVSFCPLFHRLLLLPVLLLLAPVAPLWPTLAPFGLCWPLFSPGGPQSDLIGPNRTDWTILNNVGPVGLFLPQFVLFIVFLRCWEVPSVCYRNWNVTLYIAFQNTLLHTVENYVEGLS